MKEPTERTKWLLAAPDGAIKMHWCEKHEDFHVSVRTAKEYEEYVKNRKWICANDARKNWTKKPKAALGEKNSARRRKR